MNVVPKYKFSGHQTFTFRYGWLEKGVREVAADAAFFTRDDALVKLGVGKNMVASIHHWCLVTRMIEEKPSAKRKRGRGFKPTEIASKLLLDGGWDPYLEDDASLWLIHWLLVSNPRIITTWQIAFSDYKRNDFFKQELADFIVGVVECREAKVSTGSLERDVDCFVRTYTPSRGKDNKVMPEESFDCPLQTLELIQATADKNLYRFAVGPKPTLPTAVFGYALAEYFDSLRGERNTLGVQECLYGRGSPGQAFKLDENSLMAYLEELAVLTRGKLVLDETAGLKQVYRRKKFEAISLIEDYYEGGSRL